MAKEWTKGPWSVETVKTSIGHAHKILPHNTCLYVDHRDAREVDQKTLEAKANAHLQAAAPDLYEALDNMKGALTYALAFVPERDILRRKCEVTMDAASAALSKAEGR